MPYNVIALRAGRSQIAFCKDAAEALKITDEWSEAGDQGVRVVSTEGATVPAPTLRRIANSEKRWPPPRKPADPTHAK